MQEELTLTGIQAPDAQQDMVAFRLGKQTYALPIESVVRIIEMVTIMPIPRVVPSVEGVINVRGTAVPVVNLRRHLGLPEVPLQLDTHIVLAKICSRTVGLIVDEVLDVLNVPAAQIVSPHDLLPEGLNEVPLLRGLTHASAGLVLLLDLEHLFRVQQVSALAEAIEVLPALAGEEVATGVDVETPAQAARQEPLEETDSPPERSAEDPA